MFFIVFLFISFMKFFSGKPAMVLGNSVLIADVHLGIEYEFRKKGVRMPLSFEKTVEEINFILGEANARQLIVLGDLKHDVFGLYSREGKLLYNFLSSLDCEKVLLVKGNHDSGIEDFKTELRNKTLEIISSEGLVLFNEGTSYGLVHGHAWPSRKLFEADYLFTAHNHPQIEFFSQGYTWCEQAWVIGNLFENKEHGTKRKQKLVAFPSFNPLSGGISFNKLKCSELRGPIFKNNLFDLENARAYLLNGFDLGKIKDLRKYVRKKS